MKICARQNVAEYVCHLTFEYYRLLLNFDRDDAAGQVEKEFWTELYQKFMSSDLDSSEPFSDFW